MDSIIYDLNRHLTYRLARLQSQLSAQATDILKQHTKISLSEWRVLALLTDPTITFQKDVLKAMGLDKAQISRTLKRLSEKKLIILTSDKQDQRNRLVTITDEGKALVQKMVPIMLKRQAHLQSDFNETELINLFSYIEILEKKAGQTKDFESN